MRVWRVRHLVYCLTAGLLLTNFLLIRQNLAYRDALRGRSAESLQPGDRLNGFEAADLTESPARVEFSGTGRSRVFLYLSSACPYTDVQFPYWCRLIQAADPGRFEFIGLVDQSEEPHEVMSYLMASECAPASVLRLDRQALRAYKLTITPTTLVVDGSGVVQAAWRGLQTREQVQDALEIMRNETP